MTQQPSLKLKTYFSTTVEAAVELARRELGSEAMLVNSRRAPDEVRHLGNYEVIFATGAPPEPRRIAASTARKTPADTDSQLEEIRQHLAELRQSLGTQRSDYPFAGGTVALPSSDASVFRRMLEAQGVDSPLSRELLHAVARRDPAPAGKEELRNALLEEMEFRIATDSSVFTEGSPRAVLALVGPPGRGKSTTLVKLAVSEGLAKKVPVRILSVDNYRVGAGDQMRNYGNILGIPFHACTSVGELDRHLSDGWCSEARRPGLTLVDTSGYSPNDIEEAAELAAYLSEHSEINVHLVLRADTRVADGLSTVQRYSGFGISRLVFTGVDEVESYGSLFTIAVRSGKPVSFFGSGQSIPEDLQLAQGGELPQLVMKGRPSAMLTAA